VKSAKAARQRHPAAGSEADDKPAAPAKKRARKSA